MSATESGLIDPDYARILTKARCVAKPYGWAITLHGSGSRDLDLVAVPWTEEACHHNILVAAIKNAIGWQFAGLPADRPFGRKTWTLIPDDGVDPRFVDLSVMTHEP